MRKFTVLVLGSPSKSDLYHRIDSWAQVRPLGGFGRSFGIFQLLKKLGGLFPKITRRNLAILES
jgi:hypothetical protein